MSGSRENSTFFVPLLGLSALTVLLIFLWQGHKGFNLWDEGYLWYGAQRAALGEVPIRDFMAYDPGRYYWSSFFFNISGQAGILTLRVSLALFQAVALFVALFLVSEGQKNTKSTTFLFCLLSSVTFSIWVFPYYRVFDVGSSIFLIAMLSFLLRNPSKKQFFISGMILGVTAVFGRNHGFYGLIGTFFAIFWLVLNKEMATNKAAKIAYWIGGIVCGYSPILMMLVLIPGFRDSFWESIRFLFEQKATNLALPIPWPWKLEWGGSLKVLIRSFLIGLCFLSLIFFSFVTLLSSFKSKIKSSALNHTLAATAFLSLPYAHYSFSRADVEHLALGIFPLLIGSLTALMSARPILKWSGAGILFLVSFWVMIVFHPGWTCLKTGPCEPVEISGDTLLVDPGTSKQISLLRSVADKFTPKGESFIAVPFWPGAYALLGRKSPLWEIYALWPRQEAFEKTEIERLKKAQPGFAFILDLKLDGQDDLHFTKTHPLLNAYIRENFKIVPEFSEPPYQVYQSEK